MWCRIVGDLRGVSKSSSSVTLKSRDDLQGFVMNTHLTGDAATAKMLNIPEIDISPYLVNDPEGTRRVAQEINRACTEIGFFTIIGHGVEQEQIDRTYKCAFRRIRPVVPTTSGQPFRGIRPPEDRCRLGMVFDVSLFGRRQRFRRGRSTFSSNGRPVPGGGRCGSAGRGSHRQRWVRR